MVDKSLSKAGWENCRSVIKPIIFLRCERNTEVKPLGFTRLAPRSRRGELSSFLLFFTHATDLTEKEGLFIIYKRVNRTLGVLFVRK